MGDVSPDWYKAYEEGIQQELEQEEQELEQEVEQELEQSEQEAEAGLAQAAANAEQGIAAAQDATAAQDAINASTYETAENSWIVAAQAVDPYAGENLQTLAAGPISGVGNVDPYSGLVNSLSAAGISTNAFVGGGSVEPFTGASNADAYVDSSAQGTLQTTVTPQGYIVVSNSATLFGTPPTVSTGTVSTYNSDTFLSGPYVPGLTVDANGNVVRAPPPDQGAAPAAQSAPPSGNTAIPSASPGPVSTPTDPIPVNPYSAPVTLSAQPAATPPIDTSNSLAEAFSGAPGVFSGAGLSIPTEGDLQSWLSSVLRTPDPTGLVEPGNEYHSWINDPSTWDRGAPAVGSMSISVWNGITGAAVDLVRLIIAPQTYGSPPEAQPPELLDFFNGIKSALRADYTYEEGPGLFGRRGAEEVLELLWGGAFNIGVGAGLGELAEISEIGAIGEIGGIDEAANVNAIVAETGGEVLGGGGEEAGFIDVDAMELGDEMETAPSEETNASVHPAKSGQVLDDFGSSMSEAAAEYQTRAGGLPAGKGYYLQRPNGSWVQFDGPDPAAGDFEFLIDAKYYTENGLFVKGANAYLADISSSLGEIWVDERVQPLLNEVARQLDAAQGFPIVWRVASEDAANLLTQIFTALDIDITVVHFP